MQVRKLFYAFLALFLIGISITVAGDGVQRKYLPSDKEFYLNEAEVAWLRPGVNLKIQSVAVSGSDVSVTFRIADDQDQPLDRLGIETPGTVSTSFILARIKPGDTQYTSYATRTQTSPINGKSATQATTDSGGVYTSLGNGVYRYTFGTKLPSGYEADATHTVGVYATRDLRTLAEQLGLTKLATTGRYISNATYNFVPSGKAVTVVRDVVRTEACNQCHDPLGLHGGARQITQLCILCHQPQTTDPDTGNTVDFKVMIHKIHRGRDLPSVQAGKPYQIYGFNQSLFDASEIGWPQDVRHCTTCHQQGTQSDNWKNKPNRVACGSCHDDVNFATGEHHPGGVQLDDSKCTICHQADTGVEFDLSVTGVHTIPTNSKQLAGLNVKILEVTNTKPGDKPTVAFTVTDNKGNPVDASKLNVLRLNMAGPTTDYTFQIREDARSAKAGPTGYTYTFNAALPANASGTFAMSSYGYRNVTVPGSLLGQTFNVQENVTLDPVFYFGIGGAKPVPRRQVVDRNKCNDCHKNLSLHAGTAGERRATEACVMCHHPKANDLDGNRPRDQYPLETINFRHIIHRIHTGAELENDFTIYRGGIPRNYNEKHYPGDRRNCAKCHVGTSYQLPLPSGMVPTDTPRFFYTPLGPAAAACLGCHDSQDTAAHAFLMTAPFGEACAACHGEGKEFSVTRAHAR
ncbi:MAG: OmcA/MtrC family decaheme c-type cytochrome [Acidobacteria bacterium]|nr:OmcA/MtrC family decaheme c-type cytochrome [Acidobacteriota bacterium]